MPKASKRIKTAINTRYEGGEIMADIARILLDLCTEFQTQLYVVLFTVCLAIIGGGFMVGGETAEKTKKRLPYFIFGAAILGGAITLGAKYGAQFKF